MRGELTLAHRFALLACAMLVGLNLLPGASAVLLTGAIVALASLRIGSGPVLVAIALLGLPFLRAVADMVGLTPTLLVMALDVVLLVLAMQASPALLARPAYRGVRLFLVWWLAFLLVYSILSFAAEPSEYSIFTWQYLAVYGSYYALAGVLAIRRQVSPSEAMAVGLPLFAFNYWLLEATIVSVATIADETIGLRGVEAFDPIASARMAGVVLMMALAVFLTDLRRLRWIPEIVVSIALGAPLAWYAYTRQVYVAAVIAAAWMVAVSALRPRRPDEKLGGRLALISTVCIVAAVTVWQVFELLESNSQSRIVQDGLQSDRVELWKTCLHLIAGNPIAGIGVGGFRRAGFGAWPHNWIIEAWLALGFPGLILTVIGAGVVLVALLRRCEPWLGGWVFIALYFLLVAQVSADIARNAPLFFFIVLAFHATSNGSCRIFQRRMRLRGMSPRRPEAGAVQW